MNRRFILQLCLLALAVAGVAAINAASTAEDKNTMVFQKVTLPVQDVRTLFEQVTDDPAELAEVIFRLESLPYTQRYQLAEDIAAIKEHSVVKEMPLDNAAEPPTDPTKGAVYLGSKNSARFHISTCPHVKEIKEGNLVEYESFEAAEALGKTPCAVCGASNELQERD